MAYATKAQVAEEAGIQGGFSATTLPSATKVDEIIAEVDAEIDAVIGKVYSTPIASSVAAFAIVRGISLALCAERVKGITEISGSAGEKVDQKSEVSSGSRARKKLDAIESGELPLPGATLLSSTNGVSSNVASASDCDEPIFKKEEDQW